MGFTHDMPGLLRFEIRLYDCYCRCNHCLVLLGMALDSGSGDSFPLFSPLLLDARGVWGV